MHRPPPVAICAGKFRVEPDRLGVVGDGAVVVALFSVVATAVVVRLGIFRAEIDGLVKIGEGRTPMSLLKMALKPKQCAYYVITERNKGLALKR